MRLAPLVSIDLIIRDNEQNIFVALRTNEPAKGAYLVPGGRILDRFAGEALWHLLQNVKHLEWKDPCLKPGPAGQ